MELQKFGGNWTEEKLNRLKKYLHAYTTIMRKRKFRYAYIDAFAGTGYRNLEEGEAENPLFLEDIFDQDSERFIDGSAKIALQVEPSFDKYIFIEKERTKVQELEKLKSEFYSLAKKIEIVNEDANIYIREICSKNWHRRISQSQVGNRAVLFLDPFGMQVPWETIEAIAKTEAIDLWYLFPVGIAINRLLKRDGNIRESIKQRLNETFGATDWYDTFYRVREQTDLFGNYSITEKVADFELIGEYFIERLKTAFVGVASNPLLLLNSTNTPLYLLCFASANPKGAKTAIKIAQDILKK